MIKLLFILLIYTQDINTMAIKKITKITKSVPDKSKPKEKAPAKPVMKKAGDKLEAGMVSKVGNKTTTFKKASYSKGDFGDSSYVARNYVDGDTKIDSVASVKKKKAASKGSGEKLRPIIRNSPVSHY